MTLVLVFGLSSTAANAAVVSTDYYGNVSLPYEYANTLTTSSCSNPARGAGYYGIIYKVSSNTVANLYMTSGSLGDAFIQVLQSDRRTLITQDDDAGSGYDSYLNGVSIATDQFIIATTFGSGATGTFNFYSSVPLTQVTSCPQVITTSVASSVAYGSTVNMTASTNMGLPVTVTSQTPSVCSVTSAAPNFTIRGLSVGTCTLISSQSGNGSVEAATSVTTNVTVGKANLTLTGLTGNKAYDGTTSVTLTGTASASGIQGSDVVSITGTPTGVYNTPNAGTNTITVSGLTLSGANAGSYQLVNTISGTITKINATFTWAPVTNLYVANSGSTVAAAITNSGGAVTYAVQSAGTTGCTISGRVLSFNAAGTCTVRATSAATTNYNAATTDVAFVITKQDQTLTWTPQTSLLALPNSTTMASATTSGNGAITYSVVDAGATGCTLSGSTLNYNSAGTCKVRATAAATSTFNATSMELDFVVSLQPQTLTVNAAESFTYGSSLTITSTSDQNLTVSVASQSEAVCTVSASSAPEYVVTAISAGTCTLISSQSGTSSIAAAGSVSTVIEILRKSLTVTGISASKVYDGSRSIPLTGSPSLSGVVGSDEVSLTGEISGTLDSASVGDHTVTLSGITLSGANAANYSLVNTLDGTVTRATPTITWNPTRIFAPSQSGVELAEAISLSGGSLTYSVEDSGSATCSLNTRNLTFSGQGSCVLKVTSAETPNYSAVSLEVAVTVSRLNQVITWAQPLTVVATQQTLDLTSTTNGQSSLSYTVLSQGTSSCQVSGNVLSFTAAGLCEVRVAAAETTDFDAASQTRVFEILRANQTINWSPSSSTVDLNTGRILPRPLPSSSLGGTITFSLRPSGARCAVNQLTGEVTFSSVGTCVVRATAAETAVANAAYLDFTFTATASLPAITEEIKEEEPGVSVSVPFTISPEVAEALTSSSGGISTVTINAQGLPELKPLQSIAMVGGKPVSVTLAPDSKGEMLIASGDGFKVELKAESKLDTSGKLILSTGGVVILSGAGFAPNSEVVVWLFSEPKRLGVITTDANGSFAGEVSVPSVIPVGEHTVQLNGETNDGQSRSVAVGVQVAEPMQALTTKTQDNSGSFIFMGLVAAGIAFAAYLMRRKRQN